MYKWCFHIAKPHLHLRGIFIYPPINIFVLVNHLQVLHSFSYTPCNFDANVALVLFSAQLQMIYHT
jgi:hypothetical protein